MLHIGSDSVCKPHFENKTIIFGPFRQLRVKKNEYFRAAFVGVFFSTFFGQKKFDFFDNIVASALKVLFKFYLFKHKRNATSIFGHRITLLSFQSD